MGRKYYCVPGFHNISATVTKEGYKIILRQLPMAESRKHIHQQWIQKLRTDSFSEHFEGQFTDSSVQPYFQLRHQNHLLKPDDH